MALIVKDRVKETTTTTGTGTVTLAGASTGFRSFADIGTGNTTYYTIAGGTEWEVGLGTYTASGTTLSRDTVLSNSLGTTALISFSAGVKDVFCTYPSEKAILGDTSAVGSTGTGNVVLDTNSSFTTDIEVRPFTSKFIGIGGGNEISNTVFGAYALANNNFGTNNIAIGDNALNQSLFGSGSIAIGTNAGSTITSGENNIYIGDSVSAFNSSAINEIVIGFGAIGIGSNKTVIGNSSTVETNLKGTTTVVGLTASGSLQLTGDATANQNIATNQTTGSLTIGGTGAATGTLNIGLSTASHTVNIANGTLTTLRVRTINIGVAGGNNTLTNTTIGTIGVQGSARSVTLINGTIRQQTFTVATLPTGVAGARSFVTDALAPTFGATVVTGGSVGVPVYHDGTSWKVG